jgi:hypothetical protein
VTQAARIGVSLDGERHTPQVHLIDARLAGLDEEGLRAASREQAARSGAAFTSRSYRFPLALIACHEAPVGVDIERIEPCDEAFGDSISTPAERAARPQRLERDRFFISLWSSKEALSKALGDALAYDPRRLEGPGSWPQGRSGSWRAAALEVGPGHLAWLCWRSTDA